MPKSYNLGDFLARNRVYVIRDENKCLYVGETEEGRAGVPSRITSHIANAAKKKPVGKLHKDINKKKNGYLSWTLEIYTIQECATLTSSQCTTIKHAEAAMIKHLNPKRNVKKK